MTNEISKLESFGEIVNGLKAVNYLRKKLYLRCLIGLKYASETTYKELRFCKSCDFSNKYYYRENCLKFATT